MKARRISGKLIANALIFGYGNCMADQPAPAFELDNHSFYWLTQVMGARDRELAAALKPHQLRVPEWRTLAALYSRQRCSMRELSDITAIDRTTLTRTVDRMVRSGWLSRLADATDMRITRLSLTADGRKLFARIWPAAARIDAQARAGLPEGAAEMLRWTLQQMKQNLDAGVPEAAVTVAGAKQRAA
jgi:DNA-binding MarR family transcriptional regulator